MRILALGALLVASNFVFAKRTVCLATLNSQQEGNLFRARLPAKDFEFVELTVASDQREQWFDKACEAQTQCDVLAVSGHFAGYFFGDSTKILNLDPMENHSCKKTCDGVLKRPKEIFLFGCNTLATKDKDVRTPEQYYKELLKDGIEKRQAAHIVQVRYGTLGDSYRSRMRRIFPGVPEIYGFDSIAPSGASVASYLDKYLKQTGDYAAHLARVEGGKTVQLIERANRSLATMNQSGISAAFRRTAFARCKGLDPSEPGYRLRELTCPLYDSNLSVTARLRHGQKLLEGGDALELAPSVMAIVNQIKLEDTGDKATAMALREFGRDLHVRDVIKQLNKGVAGSPKLTSDLESFKYSIGVIDRDRLIANYKALILPMLKTSNQTGADTVCLITSDFEEFAEASITITAEDVDPETFESPKGAAALACLKTKDERIAAAVVRSLGKPADVETRDAQRVTVLNLPYQEVAKAKVAHESITSKNEALRNLANAYFMTNGTPDARATAFRTMIGTAEGIGVVYETLEKKRFYDEALARVALNQAQKSEYASTQIDLMNMLMPTKSSLWAEALQKQESGYYESILREMARRNVDDARATDFVVRKMETTALTREHDGALVRYASVATLDRQQAERALALLRTDPNSERSNVVRFMLQRQTPGLLTEGEQRASAGPAHGIECQPARDNLGRITDDGCKDVFKP